MLIRKTSESARLLGFFPPGKALTVAHTVGWDEKRAKCVCADVKCAHGCVYLCGCVDVRVKEKEGNQRLSNRFDVIVIKRRVPRSVRHSA